MCFISVNGVLQMCVNCKLFAQMLNSSKQILAQKDCQWLSIHIEEALLLATADMLIADQGLMAACWST